MRPKRIRKREQGICAICNKEIGQLAGHIISVHKINIRDYCVNYLKESIKYCKLSNCKNEAMYYTRAVGANSFCKDHSSTNDTRLARIQPEIGKKYGKLSLLGLVDRDKEVKNKILVKCLCDCGNEKTLEWCLIRLGSVRSCGCLKLEAHESYKLPCAMSAFNKLHRQYLHSAAERKLEFLLTKDEFMTLVKSNCFYCGDSPQNKLKVNSSIAFYNGIDRVDSKQHYTNTNSVSCCTSCNYGKRTMSDFEYISHCQKVAKHWNIKNADI